MAIEIKAIKSVEELELVNQLYKRTWGTNPIPIHQTLTAAKNGGIVLGAWDGGELNGFLYSFPGFVNGEIFLCSHILTVADTHRNRGIGYDLKIKQAEEAARVGYNKIRWTYDPLECKNAYLNLSKLGAICSDYIVNCYGEMNDEFNKGMPTDRFNVEWLVQSPYLEHRQQLLAQHSLASAHSLLDWEFGVDGFPLALSSDLTKATDEAVTCLSVPVPDHFQDIKKSNPDLALDWRLKTRNVFEHAFANGWAVVHVTNGPSDAVKHYLLLRRSQLGL